MIPKKLRDKLSDLPYMKQCKYKDCKETKVEWHHALQYKKQIQEWYAIIPLCLEHHRGENGTIPADVKRYCEYLAINRGIIHLRAFYPKTDWEQKLRYLSSLYEGESSSQSLS